MTSTVHITQIDAMGISDLSLDVSRLPSGWVEKQWRQRGRFGREHHVTLEQGNAVRVVLLPAGDPLPDQLKGNR